MTLNHLHIKYSNLKGICTCLFTFNYHLKHSH